MILQPNDITFVCLPPAQIDIPSPAFSYLKSFLLHKSFKSDIIYANLMFEKIFNQIFMVEDKRDDFSQILPFIGLLNNRFDLKKDDYLRIKYQTLHPNLFLYDKTMFSELLKDIEIEYEKIISNIVDKITHTDVKTVGFTSKFYQWIPALTVATKIKEIKSSIKIIFGGWTNSKAAVDFVTLHNNIVDYAIWGEGEIPLAMLINHIHNDNIPALESIPRIVYNDKGEIKKTYNGGLDAYFDFTSKTHIPDFSDYIQATGRVKNESQLYPIERGRGCNWNRCAFCYLAQGYKYRLKPNPLLIKEIIFLIENYGIKSFFFTDNDVIGSDLITFGEFLDFLVELRGQYPEFQIRMAEIISKDLTSSLLQKMHQAGFKSIQLGIEAISEELLNKINKKQTVLDNFFVIKTALKNNIEILGANLICGTPSETTEMVMQSIDNLHHFRFVLSNSDFSFSLIPLGVANFSRYLAQIRRDHEEHNWNLFDFKNLVDDRYLKDIDPYSLFDFISSKKANRLWNEFEKLQKFYKKSKFSYTISINSKTQFTYREYVKGELIKHIEFDEEAYGIVLTLLSERKKSMERLICELRKEIPITYTEAEAAITKLASEGLIWIDPLFKDVVSIIDLI